MLASPNSSAPLDLPKSGRPRLGRMPIILWTLLLAFGILMLLVRTPLHAPPFESLTQYVCDPLPPLPNLGNRFQRYSLNRRCRAGDQVIFQRQAVVDVSSSSALKACRQEGGQISIWRDAAPSAYGAYVFQSTCGDQVMMAYKNRAAAYESAQLFVIAVGCIIILVSAMGLIWQLTRLSRDFRYLSQR